MSKEKRELLDRIAATAKEMKKEDLIATVAYMKGMQQKDIDRK